MMSKMSKVDLATLVQVNRAVIKVTRHSDK